MGNRVWEGSSEEMSELDLEACLGFNIREGRKDVLGRGKGRAAWKEKALRQGCLYKAVQGPGGCDTCVTGEEAGKAGRGWTVEDWLWVPG